MNNIILIGLMGAGKTTIGKRLAQKLSWDFVDTDQLVEERCGANISVIFEVEGEEGFRIRENRIIEEVMSHERQVIASGGGAPIKLVAGYSSIANGGFYTKPYFIDRILDYSGKLVRRYEPLLAGDENTRIIDPRHAYILHNMLSDVVYSGTAKKAKILERPDLAGKTIFFLKYLIISNRLNP